MDRSSAWAAENKTRWKGIFAKSSVVAQQSCIVMELNVSSHDLGLKGYCTPKLQFLSVVEGKGTRECIREEGVT